MNVSALPDARIAEADWRSGLGRQQATTVFDDVQLLAALFGSDSSALRTAASVAAPHGPAS
jgi:hypothetical protein